MLDKLMTVESILPNKSYVVFGKINSTVINLSSIAAGTGGFVINGDHGKGYSGRSVSSAGDVDGDGLDDLIIGAPGEPPEPLTTLDKLTAFVLSFFPNTT
jgi:hypothetical protein